jgi:hypothetical protein
MAKKNNYGEAVLKELSKNLSAEFEKDFLLLIFAIFDSFI